MKKDVLKKMIQTAKGRCSGTAGIKNAKVVDVFNEKLSMDTRYHIKLLSSKSI